MGWYKYNGDYKFKLPPNTITCPDCEGHGTEQWECWCCEGHGTMKWRRAVALGWRKSDLSNLGHEDDYCDCPRDDCRCRDSCDTCAGDGYVPVANIEIEITRVLLYGITDDIPPRYYVNQHTGHLQPVRFGENLLSKAAAHACKARKWVTIYCDIFGHSVSLTDAGQEEALRRLPEWTASHDSRWELCDPVGRLADDGCPNEEREYRRENP